MARAKRLTTLPREVAAELKSHFMDRFAFADEFPAARKPTEVEVFHPIETPGGIVVMALNTHSSLQTEYRTESHALFLELVHAAISWNDAGTTDNSDLPRHLQRNSSAINALGDRARIALVEYVRPHAKDIKVLRPTATSSATPSTTNSNSTAQSAAATIFSGVKSFGKAVVLPLLKANTVLVIVAIFIALTIALGVKAGAVEAHTALELCQNCTGTVENVASVLNMVTKGSTKEASREVCESLLSTLVALPPRENNSTVANKKEDSQDPPSPAGGEETHRQREMRRERKRKNREERQRRKKQREEEREQRKRKRQSDEEDL